MELLYGRNSVNEALRAGRRAVRRLLVADAARGLEPLLAVARSRGVAFEVVDRHHLDRLVGDHHQGVVAEADTYPYVAFDSVLGASAVVESGASSDSGSPTAPLLLVLDSLQDPQNFGTLLRSALAVGVDGVLIPEHRAVGVTPAVSNASAGAVEHLRIARVTNLVRALRSLKSSGVWVHGLAVGAGDSYWDTDLRGPLALVVGSEGEGLSRLVRETCDVLVHIPMVEASIQSLNASTAGSLVLYEAFRQRGATLQD